MPMLKLCYLLSRKRSKPKKSISQGFISDEKLKEYLEIVKINKT